ncbi:hypothetical protein CJU89_4397 [Yarrowia sp. B02]|nr:hypothetical protein CJU89_4397 [Yarrowia sp. B02]
MKIRKAFVAAFLVLCALSAYLGFAKIHIQYDKAVHFVTFFILTAVFYWILDTSRRRCINASILVCTLFGGVGSEFAQTLFPHRTFDPMDILCNVAGSLLAVILCALYHQRMLTRARLARYQPVDDSAIAVAPDPEPDLELGDLAADDERNRA